MKPLVLRSLKTPLVLEERPDPQPGEGQVLVQLKAAALNRRDFWIQQGLYPGIQLPAVLGSDGAGVVAAIGDGVAHHWSGQDVIFDPGIGWGDSESAQSSQFHILGMPEPGTFATHVLVPAVCLHPKPPHLNWFEAATLGVAGVTAYRALFSQGRLQAGESLLISGVGGGVATFALQFGVAAGAHVVVSSSSADKLSRACELGAVEGFSYREAGWNKQVQAKHGAMDLIVDSAAGDGYANLIDLAAPGGRVVNYGATAGAPQKLDMFKIFWKQLHLIGSTMGSPRDFAAMLEFVNRHAIRPVIDRIFPLSAANDALALMKDSKQFGKIVLDCESLS